MKKIHLLAPVIVTLLGLSISAPLLISYDKHIPGIQTKLGQHLNSKVEIGRITFSYLPSPAFTLEKIRIGNEESASIGKITLPVTTRLLLSAGSEIEVAHLESVTVSPRFALALPSHLTPNTKKPLRIRKASLSNAIVTLKQETLGPLDALLEFKPDNSIDRLSLRSAEGNSTLEIQPADTSGTFNVHFLAKDWKLPYAYPVKFDAIQLIGKATAESLQITEARGSLYEGVITGRAQLDWRNQPALSGQITARGIKGEALIRLFSPVTRTSGQLAGDATFRYEANSLKTLFDTPRLQGRFILSDGMIHNLDLSAPLRSSSPEQKRHGGQTSFNLFSGNISVQGKDVALRGLKLESGKFRASGEVSIRDGKLSGGAGTSIGNGELIATNRVTLSGTLAAPELQSGGAWRPPPPEASEP